MARSTVGIGSPTEVGLRSESAPVSVVATDDDSVRPYAFVVAFRLGKVSRTRRCISSAEGEPPKLTEMTVDVS